MLTPPPSDPYSTESLVLAPVFGRVPARLLREIPNRDLRRCVVEAWAVGDRSLLALVKLVNEAKKEQEQYDAKLPGRNRR